MTYVGRQARAVCHDCDANWDEPDAADQAREHASRHRHTTSAEIRRSYTWGPAPDHLQGDLMPELSLGKFVIVDGQDERIVGSAGSLLGCFRRLARAEDGGATTHQDIASRLELTDGMRSVTITLDGRPHRFWIDDKADIDRLPSPALLLVAAPGDDDPTP